MKEPENQKLTARDTTKAHFSLLSQMRERRVFRSAAAYAIVAWGITEILDGVITGLAWPDWLATLVVILFVMGFPVAMFLAWVYDWTPDGIRRSPSVAQMGWLPAIGAAVFLIAGTSGLFWLINPSGIVHAETIGIAVLPCRYRGEPANEYRGAGFAEVLSNRLAYSNQLFVPDFNSVRSISALSLDTIGLAERLNVAWLIDCRVNEKDGKLRIETSIVDVETDQSNTLSSSAVGSLQILDSLNEIETAIYKHIQLAPAKKKRNMLDAYLTSSLDAFDEYLAGLHSMRIGTVEGYEQAGKHFRDAQQIEEFPLARLGEVNALLAGLESAPPKTPSTLQSRLKAADLILDQIELREPAPAELFAARLRLARLVDLHGAAQSVSGERRKEWLNRAETIRPNYAEPNLYYADYLEFLGDAELAATFRRKAGLMAPE